MAGSGKGGGGEGRRRRGRTVTGGAAKRKKSTKKESSCFTFIEQGRITLRMHNPRWSGQILHFHWLLPSDVWRAFGARLRARVRPSRL